MDTSKMTLEEKVDLLLKYQQKAIFWGRVKSVITLILFIVLFVLPIVWSAMFMRSLLEGVNMEGFVENIKTVGNLGGSLEGFDIQSLLN